MKTKRQEALDTASEIIHGDRNKHYGEPNENFTRIAVRWSMFLGRIIEPWQVAVMMIDLKMARLCEGYADDSITDIIGYAALTAEIKDERIEEENTNV